MQDLSEQTTRHTNSGQTQQRGERRSGLCVATGGQGVLRRISGPAILVPLDPTPVSTTLEATPVAAVVPDLKPTLSSPSEDESLQAELKAALEKLVDQEIMSFRLTSMMSTNAIGGTLHAQHTYQNSPATIHAIDIAAARTREKLQPQRLRAVKRLRHPSLLSVLHHATHHRFILAFTDAVDGVSIADMLTQQGPMSERRALTIVQNICEGLASGHQSQLTHGGICPEHIFIGPDEQPKVVDFCWHLYVPEGGTDPFQCDKSVYGNVPKWTRAPEVFTDTEVDYRADIYALGATFHQMVTGQHPFPPISDPQLRREQSQTSLKRPHELNPSLSRETSDLITAMIEPNADRRINHYDGLLRLFQNRLAVQRGRQTQTKRSRTRKQKSK